MFKNSDSDRPIVDLQAFLEVPQAKKIIKTSENMRDRLLMSVLANTGRRISEALMLKPKDIDLENDLIYWRILKRKGGVFDEDNRFGVIMPIATNKRLIKNVINYVDHERIERNEYVFRSSHRVSMPIHRTRAYQIVYKWSRLAGIPKVGTKNVHPHTFRHSFCVWGARLLKNPADLIILKNLMAHASINTTMKYLIFAPREAKNLVNNYPDFMMAGLSDEEAEQELIKPKDFDFRQIGNIDIDL
jgi:integrase/recombinase XerD